MPARRDTLGIGIIGAGFMGATYAETITQLVKRATLRAVTGGSRAAALAKDYGVAAEADVDALTARPDVDIVIIASPHAAHGEQGLTAARAGKHLLIDKPMATTTAACDAILAACVERGLRCEITYTQRERVCNVETKRLLDEGRLGRLLHIHNMQVVPDGMQSSPPWQLLPENIGILMGHAIHNIDQLRWFTGREVAKVFAKLRSFNDQYEVDGTADLILTLDDGTVCTIFSSFEVPPPGMPHTGGATQIICERGLIDADWYGELKVAANGNPFEGVASQPPIDWAGKGFLDPVRLETYAKAIQRLVDAVCDAKPAGGLGWDGRQAVAVAEAAYESSRTGREVTIPSAQAPPGWN